MNDSRVIDNFLSLCAVPHPSHHEEAISRFLCDWGVKRGLRTERDAVGNIIIEKDAAPGLENAPVTILQGHMDMVAVAESGRCFDPLRDPIRVINDGRVLRADGTSLGGDDCIGVALGMTILEDDAAVHGPIRAIFTVNEEDGMTGAEALDPRHLAGKYMINLDWEEDGSLCCSSAGSDQYLIRRAAERIPAEGCALRVRLDGFTGGHSGTAIHYGRANAIRELAALLRSVHENGISVSLSSFTGGTAHNAIPPVAEAVVVVPETQKTSFTDIVKAAWSRRVDSIRETDPEAKLFAAETAQPETAISAADTDAFCGAMLAVFNGVRAMSATIPGLVETSSNLGVARLTETAAEFIVHQRSSELNSIAELKREFQEKAAEFGFAMSVISSTPPWPVRPGSVLVEKCLRAYRDLAGRDMVVEPIHAGLECGSFSVKNPALDIISIGPDILDIHSPRETLVLETVFRLEALVRALLKDIAHS